MNEGQEPRLNQGQQGPQGSEWPPLPQVPQVSEWPQLPLTPQEAAPVSVAKQLGFPEEVNILRTSGAIEPGWHIASVDNLTNRKTGQKEDYIRVISVKDGEFRQKHVTFDEMNELNPKIVSDDLDDDTIPRSRLSGYKDEQAKNEPEDQVDQPELDAVSYEVAEEVGEVAVEESDLVQEPSLVSANESEPENSSSEPEQNSPNNYGALQELAELWGMPEDMTSEQALKHLEAESQQLEQMTRLLSSFDGTRHTAAKAILDTLQDRGIVFLGNNTKAAVDDLLLDHRNSRVIIGFDVTDKNTLLPVRLRKDIEHFQADFKSLQRTWADATEGFRNGRPAINGEPAQQAANLLNRSLPDLHRALLSAARQVKGKINDLGGVVSDAKLAEVEKEIYRNPEWVKRAEKLKDASIDDPELEKLVVDIENDIRRESGRPEDPKSPGNWFGNQIIENKGKGRQDTITSGRPMATSTSQRVASEIAADILRGKFSYDRAKSDSVQLSPDGKKVILGEHRAAALATIYGPDRWIEEGRKLGMIIDQR